MSESRELDKKKIESEMGQPYCEKHGPKGITCDCDVDPIIFNNRRYLVSNVGKNWPLGRQGRDGAMTSADEIGRAIDSLGKAALGVKRERDILVVAFKKVRDILVEMEIELEQANSANEDSGTITR